MNGQQIEEFTASISGFDLHRKYIGLSNIFLDADTLINNYNQGQTADHLSKLKCYKGYQMEKDLVHRIQKVYGNKISFKDILAFDNLVQGHPDFWYEEIIPGDCKSVLLDSHLPDDKLPRKVYWQVQGYMLYGNAQKAIVIYESRESGRIRHRWVNRNEVICREIQTKIETIIRSIQPVLA
ncbi:MAG TPA: hypothetical protein PKD91_05870 [Bacteroidia bacterium]|nr:hypothetical protein [Bacteroidia bacterium]